MIIFVAAFIWLLMPLQASDLYLSCAIHPLQHSKAILGKQAGASDRLWTCGIVNSGTMEQVVTEADIIVAMQGLGVRALQSAAVRVVMERKLYTGRLRTTARIFQLVVTMFVAGAALEVIQLSAGERAVVGLLSVGLPILGPALKARTPDGTGLEILRVSEPLGIKPGGAVKIAMWSAPHDGPLIVRGYMLDYTAPSFAPSITASPPVLEFLPGRFSVTQNNSPILAIPLPRCSHILPLDCLGMCEGWWRFTG